MILSKLGYLHADLAINRGFNRNHHLSNLLSLQVGGVPAGIIGILAGILIRLQQARAAGNRICSRPDRA